MRTRLLINLLISFLSIPFAFADEAPPEPNMEACFDLMTGDACTYTGYGDEGRVTGTCQSGVCIANNETEAGAQAGEQAGAQAGEQAGAQAGEQAGADAGGVTVATTSEDQGCNQSVSSRSHLPLSLLMLGVLIRQRKEEV